MTPKQIDLVKTTSDVLLAVKQIAAARGTSAGKVLSELAREALRPSEKETVRNGVPLFPSRPGVVVTLDMVNQMRDDEEV